MPSSLVRVTTGRTDPEPCEATTTGSATTPRRVRPTTRRRLAEPSTVTDDGGSNDIINGISLSDSEEVTVETPGEATVVPKRGKRVRKQPSYLKDYVQ